MAEAGSNADAPLPPSSSKSSIPRFEHGGGRRDQQRGRGNGRGSERGRKGNDRGARGGRGGRHKKAEMGRAEWSRDRIDKRKRNDEHQASKRQKITVHGRNGVPEFSKDEIEGEERKPKRKVAVLIGYAGTGYSGMQINDTEKTIEGDIFKAFVIAGAISKANADDHKKSSLVRCARTDKGVHAAGNVISLKLIVEDPQIVEKINDALPPQIRVWGIERTNGSFSSYQSCDSRWYEYLIPTYSFLPPHPKSFLAKKLVQSAEEEGIYESYQSRQEEVFGFWEDAEKNYIEPLLDKLDPELRASVLEAIHMPKDELKSNVNEERVVKTDSTAVVQANGECTTDENDLAVDILSSKKVVNGSSIENASNNSAGLEEKVIDVTETADIKSKVNPVDAAVKEIKAAYIKAKKAYRISTARRQRIETALSAYVGTHNFHNYTIQKTFKEASAMRVIRSFRVNPTPIIINNTEWLSLKVHGQSFMMHQIRKMVAMAALVVRCGCSVDLINDSYGSDVISIPKAPGLGLLLERPVFDSYNKKATEEFEREKLDFGKYTKEIDEFKHKEIYQRIFAEEEQDNQFNAFFHHIDTYRSDYFLWVTAKGIAAAKQSLVKGGKDGGPDIELVMDSEDEADAGGQEG